MSSLDEPLTPPAARILLVSDDEQLRSLLYGLLVAHGYRGAVSVDTKSALATIGRPAELAVVDASVSVDGAMRVLRELRRASIATVAIFATRVGAAAPRELVACSDVLVGKPFDPRELLLVIRGILDSKGAAAQQTEATVKAGPIVLSTLLSHATVNSREIALTGVETRLLFELMINASRPVTRDRLMRRSLLRAESDDTRVLDTHIKRLRRKVGNDRRGKTPIRTVRGVGYLLIEHWEPSE